MKNQSATGILVLRCFCLYLCMVGTFLTMKEAFRLDVRGGWLSGLLAVQSFLLCIAQMKGGRWKYLRYAWNLLIFAESIRRWERLVSGYFAVENGIRGRIGEYYNLNLAQRKLSVDGEQGESFLILIFTVLLWAFGSLVVKRGKTALLALVQVLVFTLELLCGCRFEKIGIYLILCSILVLFAMGNRKEGRNPRILCSTGIWAGSLVLILTIICAAWIGPLLFKKSQQLNEKLYDTVQQATARITNAVQSQNGLFGDHTPTADGSLSNYRVNQDEETDLRVTVDEKPENSMYLRGFIGDTYEGTYWHRIDEKVFEEAFSADDAKYQVQNILYRYIEEQADGEKNKAIVERLRPGGEYGYIPYGFETPNDSNLMGDSFYTSAEKQNDYTGYVNWRKWLGSGAAPENASALEQQYRAYVGEQYLKIPLHGLERLKAYCEQWDFDTVQEVIEFVVPAVQEGRPYSMDLKPVPKGQDFAEYFFFDQKKGYCIHYATTAVLMFRMMGVPARYVTGYVVSPDRFSETENGFTADVPDSQAHAWVEVYRAGKGWIPVEVTPGYGSAGGESGMEDLSQGGGENPQQEQGEPTSVPAAATPEPQPPEKDGQEETEKPQNTESIEEGKPDEKSNGTAEDDSQKTTSGAKLVFLKILQIFLTVAVVTALAAGAILANRRRILKKRKQRFGQKNRNKAICEISYGLYQMLSDAGIGEADTKDLEYARKMEEKLEVLEKGEYVKFIKLVQRAAYGPNQLTAEEHRSCLQFYHKIAGHLWQQMTKRKKIWWKYMKCYEIS